MNRTKFLNVDLSRVIVNVQYLAALALQSYFNVAHQQLMPMEIS